MSAKWRAIQHRHRYTYNAVVFPGSYVQALDRLPSEISSHKFFAELRAFASLNSVHAQVNRAKSLASSFADVLLGGAGEDSVSEASRFFLEILFLDNSVPLHRTLVTGLAKARDFRSVICGRFRELCDEYGGKRGKRFCVSRTALSVMSMPKLGFLVDVVEDCAVLVARDVVTSLNAVVSETRGWARPSPILMEQCQEALSCLYYLFQRFPSKFRDLSDEDEDSEVLATSLNVILSVLKSPAFSRDCFVSAGVCFFAALQVCIGPEDLGLIVIEGIFYQTVCGLNSSESKFENAIAKVPYKRDFRNEIRSFSALSRLCLIRGVLTAVPRTVLSNQFSVSMSGGHSVRTILYDGILPELCSYCENPTDSHFNFHALSVLQICLQQIKTLMLGNLTNQSRDYDPIPEDIGTRVLKIIWNNLEDPLSQTVKQVHLIFDLFLDIRSSLQWSEGSERIKSYLQKIASDLLHLGPRCKGRYVPLASLTKRLGAKTILEMSPHLLFETVYVYINDDVCCAATSFMKCFLENLRDECWSSEGIESGYALYRGHCLPPILYGLASGVSKLRSNLNTYVLPVLLEIDVDSIFSMLSFISVEPREDGERLLCAELSKANMELRVEQKVAILVSLLKVSRFLALIEGDIDWCKESLVQDKDVALNANCSGQNALFCIKGIQVRVLVEWLVLALTNVDESLRVDAAEFLFLNPKTSSLPSYLELTLLKEAVPLNMRSSSTAFQMKWASLFRKFFSRVRTALERQFKQGNLQPCDSQTSSEKRLINGSTETEAKRAYDLFLFMRWLGCFLFFSCYPSAPYKRKMMAMDLILIMLNVWSILPTSEENCGSSSTERCLYLYNKGITSPDSTLLLIGSVVDSWDKLRENSFRILLHFPTPLPGISDETMVQNMILWGKKLVCSPRVRESDAGALTFRLIFRKYVVELGWVVNASANTVCSRNELENGFDQIPNSSSPVVRYIKSLIDWLEATVKDGERDLSEACKNSFVHGVLLALRYTFEELDFNSDAVLSSTSGMRQSLATLLELVLRITSLALWVVSADAWYLPEDMDEMADDDAFSLEVSDDVDVRSSSYNEEDKNSKPARNSRTSEQVVMVGCWLAMKEVSLLLGTITRKIALPGNAEVLDSEGSSSCDGDSSDMVSTAMLEAKQLETIGNHFLEVLLKMKHNGAIDKTRAGFTALCNRLLCSNDPRLCQLTESWMEQLMEKTVAKGQTVDDLLRRSAGIPAAFIALFLSEPEGAPKKLLPRALQWLIDLAKKSLLEPVETTRSNGDLCGVSSINSDQNKYKRSSEMDVSDTVSKIRDEGVIPTVHAFNVLRAAFNDTNLATDTSGFAAEALILSIRSFSSQYWEVRNSACLAYTALVRRMIGFLNVHKRDSARRALTGLEFLHRYPALHPFLLSELKVATDMLGNGSSRDLTSNLSNVVHPSLCPMLILLSRLKPSTIASETGDDLDPFLLTPFIRRCSTQSNLKVRLLASKALTGLVSNEKLPTVLLNIASELPSIDNQVTVPESSTSLDQANGSHQISFNWIHGALLQLCSLLDTNCRNLADFSKKDQILSDLIQVLFKCSWIASPKWCPCPVVNDSFLRVLDHMLSISRTCNRSRSFYPVRNLLLELSTECLDVDASYGLSYYDPTISKIRQQAAVSYFSCVFQASEEEAEDSLRMLRRTSLLESNFSKMPEMENSFAGLQERLVRSLSDSAYEVRLATLKWLFKFLKSTESGSESPGMCNNEIKTIQSWSSTNLQTTLFDLLASEKNHRCSYYILRILFTWNSLQFVKAEKKTSIEAVSIGGMDCETVFLSWDKFYSLYETSRHAKTRETLLQCLGICVKRFTILFANSILVQEREEKLAQLAQIYDRISVFTNLIKKHSAASEPASMRTAAAESIIACGMLEHAELVGSMVSGMRFPFDSSFSCFEPCEAINMYARQILDIWFTCIKLLEDEDDDIRLRLAMDVQGCFTCKTSARSSHAGVVPTQVEKVIGLCFDHLSSIFGNWIEYFDHLLQSVLVVTEKFEVPNGDLIRRVFDKEIDNHHEEKLLISQICCSHLEKLPISKSWPVDSSDKQRFKKYLLRWRLRFLDQLMSYAVHQSEKKNGLIWLGGVGNHKDAFLPLYANLLGFFVLSNCIFNTEIGDGDDDLVSGIVELGKTLSPYLRNPLIVNLYLLVVKSHENFFGRTIEHPSPGSREEDNSIWDGFDPFFLLSENTYFEDSKVR